MSDTKRTRRAPAPPPPLEPAPPPRRRDKSPHVAVRLDDATLARIERVRLAMVGPAVRIGVLLSLSDVLRAALGVGLRALEAEYKLSPPPPTAPPVDGRAYAHGKPRKPRK